MPFFSTNILAWGGNTPLYYYANRVRFSPQGDLWVSFVGTKPFGVLDAVMCDKKGRLSGYWRQDRKSHSTWFDLLTATQKRDMMDEVLDIAFSGTRVFIGRSLQGGGDAVGINHSVIQMFILKGGKNNERQ